jgi:ribonuclease HI
MRKITIFTDGGARGNPGPAGAGAVIFDEKNTILAEISEYVGEKTNNYAEYSAVVLALEALKKKIPKKERKQVSVRVRMDSELIARQLSGQYQIKEPTLFPFFIAIHNMCVSEFPNIIFTHVPRGENKHADRLANEAMDRGR